MGHKQPCFRERSHTCPQSSRLGRLIGKRIVMFCCQGFVIPCGTLGPKNIPHCRGLADWFIQQSCLHDKRFAAPGDIRQTGAAGSTECIGNYATRHVISPYTVFAFYPAYVAGVSKQVRSVSRSSGSLALFAMAQVEVVKIILKLKANFAT
jgi:hypothetical protein